MIVTYKVTGMTCNGCRISVEKSLQALPQVTSASVDLEKEEAVIVSSNQITAETLQGGLPDKFTITSINDQSNRAVNIPVESLDKQASKLKQLQPLFLILGLISASTIALHYSSFKISEAMLTFMGLFYIFFSLFKFLDIKGFAISFAMYDPLAKAAPLYARIYPFLEVVLGIFFLARVFVLQSLIATIIILGITTIGVTRSLLKKQDIQCACLGTVLKLPMTLATFIENAIMIVMAIFMLTQIVAS